MDTIVVNRYGVLGFRIVYAVHKDNPYLARMRETLRNRVEIQGLTSLDQVRSYSIPRSFSAWRDTLKGLGENEDIILLCPLYPLYGEIRTAGIFKEFLSSDDSVKFYADNKEAPPICASCSFVLECLKTNTTPLSLECQYAKTADNTGVAISNMLKAMNKEAYEEFISGDGESMYDTIAPLLGIEAHTLEVMLTEETEETEEAEEAEEAVT